MLQFKEGTKMKKMIIAILAVAALSFAEKNEVCNHADLSAGFCYSDGYICNLSTEMGGVRFTLGKNSSCKEAELLQTDLVTYFHKMKNGVPEVDPATNLLVLDTERPMTTLKPVLAENPAENTTALSVAINTANLINAANEKFKVRVIYHQPGHPDVNSVHLLSVQKIADK